MSAAPKIGERFGELTVVESDGPPRHGKEPQVELQCDCGRPALRTVRYLKQARRERTVSMCRECLEELNRGYWELSRSRRKEFWTKIWGLYGTLYSWAWEQQFVDELRREIGVEEPVPKFLVEESTEPSASLYDPLIPIHHKHGWGCETCSRPFTEGEGCLDCAGVYCSHECAMGIEHLCPDKPEGATLEQIAAVFGVHKERIRQIEGKALRRLAHRAHGLHKLWYGLEDEGTRKEVVTERLHARIRDKPEPEPVPEPVEDQWRPRCRCDSEDVTITGRPVPDPRVMACLCNSCGDMFTAVAKEFPR